MTVYSAIKANPQSTGLNIHPFPTSPHRSTSQPPQVSKSVAFALTDPPQDPGYETDDSDSTVEPYSSSHRGGKNYRRDQDRDSHHHHHLRRSSSVPYPPMPYPSPASPYHHRHHPSTPKHYEGRDRNKVSEADSDSTIDLPNRFDGQGRLLPERDPAVDKFEDLVNRFTKVLF